MHLRLGRIFGIPITMRGSFLLLMLFVVLAGHGVSGLAMLLITFASVLIHELGHARVAQYLNVPIVGIDLHFFGGAAKMSRMPRSARDEILIAAAGPAVSFAVAAAAFALSLVFPIAILRYLALINAILGAFNLLPALPMDGGRILRAALSQRMGRLPATKIAVRIAKGFALVMGVYGITSGQFFLSAMAVLLWSLAANELRAATMWRYSDEEPPRRAPRPPTVEVIDPFNRRIYRVDGISP